MTYSYTYFCKTIHRRCLQGAEYASANKRIMKIHEKDVSNYG